MALASQDFMTAPGVYGTNLDKIDCSDVLSAILLKDTSTLGQVPMKGSVHNIEHFWIEDTLNPAYIQGNWLADTATLTITVTWPSTSAKIGAIVRDNTVMRCNDSGLQDCLFIPVGGLADWSVGTSHSMAFYGRSSIYAVTIGNTATINFYPVQNPYADNTNASEDISQTRTRRKNYTQVFEAAIEIEESRKHIELYAIPDELKYQIKQRTYELKRLLNKTILHGSARFLTASTVVVDHQLRTMQGIIPFIRDPDLDGTAEDTTVLSASEGALTVTRINELISALYTEGGFDDESNCCIIVASYQARVIALLEQERIRRSSKERVVGTYANSFKSDLGFELPVIIDRWMREDGLLILDRSRVSLMPLRGDAWHLEKMAKTGRTQKYQMSGQYTMELRNAESCHGYYQRLATS